MSERTPEMQGFDPQWRDPPDYIIGITRAIWEGREIDSLTRLYDPAIPVRSPTGMVQGNRGVIAATMAALAEFPDRALLAEDVIWCPAEVGGFLSSHRVLSLATHTGAGAFGEPTGKQLVYRVVADCAARDNAIYDEWLVRDLGAVVRQMGWEPKAYAADLIGREGGPEQSARPFGPADEVQGIYQGGGNDHPAGQRYAAILSRIMAGGLEVVAAEYDRAVQVELPGGITGHGHAAVDRFWLGLRAAFPSAEFTVEHCIGRDDAWMPQRAALRWSLSGRHDGWGSFGAPSGAEVHVMGICHAEFGPWGLRREFTLLDEVAIWKQILLHTG